MRASWLAGLLCFALAASALPSYANIPGSALDGDVRSITSGGKFGVSVGMDIEEARMTLEQHSNVGMSGSYPCDNSTDYGRNECKGADTVTYFVVDVFLSGGKIAVYSREGKVARLVWWRNPFDP